MFQTILVCSDGSESALKAARAAAEIACKLGSSVILVSIYTPRTTLVPFAAEAGSTFGAMAAAGDETHSAIEQCTVKIFEEAGVPYHCRRETGNVVDRIVAVAGEEKADLIMLGCRGCGGLRRMLVGSTLDGVLHHAHCSVFVVR